MEWNRALWWAHEVKVPDGLNIIVRGWDKFSNDNLFRIEIPAEGWNLFLYGCNFPIIGLEPFINGLLYDSWASMTQSNPLPSLLCGSGDPSTRVNEPEYASEMEGGVDLEISPSTDQDQEGTILEPQEEVQSKDSEGEREISDLFLQESFLSTKGVGRKNKLKALEAVGCDRNMKAQSGRKRGRKPRKEVGAAILREISEGSGGVDPTIARLQATTEREGSGGYFTRATKAWMLGKSAGLRYPGSDEEAIRGLAEELMEDRLVI